MVDPLLLALDGFVATLLALGAFYTRKTITSVRGSNEKPWILIFLSLATFFVGSLVQFYSDFISLAFPSPFIVAAAPASALLVAALVYGYRTVIGNNLMLEMIVDRMRAQGFDPRRDGRLTGASGVEHEFNVLGQRDKIRVGVDVRTTMLEVGEIPVLQLFTKSLDVGRIHPVIVAMPGMSAMGRKLATSYRITIIEGRTNDMVLKEMDSFLGDLKAGVVTSNTPQEQVTFPQQNNSKE